VYNLWVRCYNLYITLYNRWVDWHNQGATEEAEESIIPTDLHNEQIEEYNRHVDQYNVEH
jgi:hypothetical protein